MQDCGDKGWQTQVNLVEIGGRGFFAQLVCKLFFCAQMWTLHDGFHFFLDPD